MQAQVAVTVYDVPNPIHNQARPSRSTGRLWMHSEVVHRWATVARFTAVRSVRLATMRRLPATEHCMATSPRRQVLLTLLLLSLAAHGVLFPASVSADAEPRFVWPLDPRPALINPFDPPEHDWLPGHRGVDLGGRTGETVRAAGAGIVVFAGMVAGRPVVSIDHPNGVRTTYEPVEGVVQAGRRVQRGEAIGRLIPGHADCSTPCLHWGVRRGTDYLDPLGLIRITPIRLLPLEPA